MIIWFSWCLVIIAMLCCLACVSRIKIVNFPNGCNEIKKKKKKKDGEGSLRSHQITVLNAYDQKWILLVRQAVQLHKKLTLIANNFLKRLQNSPLSSPPRVSIIATYNFNFIKTYAELWLKARSVVAWVSSIARVQESCWSTTHNMSIVVRWWNRGLSEKCSTRSRRATQQQRGWGTRKMNRFISRSHCARSSTCWDRVRDPNIFASESFTLHVTFTPGSSRSCCFIFLRRNFIETDLRREKREEWGEQRVVTNFRAA